MPRFFQTVDCTVCICQRKEEKERRECRDNTDVAFQTMDPLVLATRLHDLPCLQPARKRAAVSACFSRTAHLREELHAPLSGHAFFLIFFPHSFYQFFFISEALPRSCTVYDIFLMLRQCSSAKCVQETSIADHGLGTWRGFA